MSIARLSKRTGQLSVDVPADTVVGKKMVMSIARCVAEAGRYQAEINGLEVTFRGGTGLYLRANMMERLLSAKLQFEPHPGVLAIGYQLRFEMFHLVTLVVAIVSAAVAIGTGTLELLVAPAFVATLIEVQFAAVTWEFRRKLRQAVREACGLE